MDVAAFRESTTEAIQYWEGRRLLYNAVLAVIVGVQFLIAFPGSKAGFSWDGLLRLFLLAVLANVAYSTAYIVDVFAQTSAFREPWRKRR